MAHFAVARERMVREQIEARGIGDPVLLEAFRAVPRELFVDPDLARAAYEDRPLPIASGQTISQPFIVAHMIAAARVRPGQRVLEVGAGSGYAAAVLAHIAGEVVAVERLAALAESARALLARLGIGNVRLVAGDGTLGAPDHAPFDAIIVSAAGSHLPEPLMEQLADGGVLVMPVGAGEQRLVRVTRCGSDLVRETLDPVRFVPLIGAEGWPAERA